MYKKIVQFILGTSVIMLTACTTTSNHVEQLTPTSNEHFLIGTYTKDTSKGVYKVILNPTEKPLINQSIITTNVNPSYLALSKNQSTLFAATGSQSGSVDRLIWNDTSQQFDLVQQMKGLGKGTCHISLNPQETQVAIANYGSGDMHLFNINKNSKELSKAGHFKNEGKGPSWRQNSRICTM